MIYTYVSMQEPTREGLKKFKSWHVEKASGTNMSEDGKRHFLSAAQMIQSDIDYINTYQDMVNSKTVLSRSYIPTADARTSTPLPIIEPDVIPPIYCGRR